MNGRKILVVDDEETLCEALKFNLEMEGYDVDVAYSAEEALTRDLTVYSLVLLDVMMGEISGFQMARMMKTRPETAHVPIIFCTAKDSEDEMVGGLNLGADDYVTKPYTLRNLIARVKSVLRRTASDGDNGNVIVFDALILDKNVKRLTIDGEEIKMPKKEFEILLLLVENRGRIFSRYEILDRVWKGEAVVVDRVIDVHITRLRKKIGKYGKNIITRSGYGYGFDA